MICRTRQDETETLSTPARWWLWSILALLALSAIGLRAWQIKKHDADQQAWIARCTQIETLSKATNTRIQNLWNRSNSGNSRMKRSDLEQAINGGKQFVTRSSNDGATADVKWIDPTSGRPFEFNFIDNLWIGLGSQGGSFLYPPPPTATPLENDLEHLRGAIGGWNSGYAPLLWIIVLIMTLSLRRWRPVMAQAMLALAVPRAVGARLTVSEDILTA